MSDQIVRALTVSGGIRIISCCTSALANEICLLQNSSPTASVALGRALTGAALMGALLKEGQRVALKFEGNGLLNKIVVEAEWDGAVRGSVSNPSADIEPVAGKWNVAGLLGRAGFLTVSKDLGMGGAPYSGMVQLRTSEIGDDLAYYLTDSEQIPSAVGVTASIDENSNISSCGGFLVQALPNADLDEIDYIMNRIEVLPSLSELLLTGDAIKLISAIFEDIPYTMLGKRDLFFRCGCSIDKVERALLTFGENMLNDMLQKQSGASVTCEFCRQQYNLNESDLSRLITNSRQITGN